MSDESDKPQETSGNAVAVKRPESGKRKANRGSFQKGNKAGVGNGRPPLSPEYKEAMRTLGRKGLEVLQTVLENPKHPQYVTVALKVVERQYGVPKQGIELSGPGGGAVTVALTTTEAREKLAQLAATAAAAATGDDAGTTDGSGSEDTST